MHMTEPQTINASAAVTAISWTGGKDCNLALLRSWRDGNFDVRYLLVFRLCTKPFQAHVSLERIMRISRISHHNNRLSHDRLRHKV